MDDQLYLFRNRIFCGSGRGAEEYVRERENAVFGAAFRNFSGAGQLLPLFPDGKCDGASDAVAGEVERRGSGTQQWKEGRDGRGCRDGRQERTAKNPETASGCSISADFLFWRLAGTGIFYNHIPSAGPWNRTGAWGCVVLGANQRIFYDLGCNFPVGDFMQREKNVLETAGSLGRREELFRVSGTLAGDLYVYLRILLSVSCKAELVLSRSEFFCDNGSDACMHRSFLPVD